MGKSKKNSIKNDYTNLKNLNLTDLISNLKTIKNIIDLSNYLSIQLSNLNIHSPTLDYSDYLLPFHNSKKSFYNGPLNYCKQDYILELSNFINNLQKNIISNNLLKLSLSFIEDQKKASLTNLDTTNLSIAQQLLIQIISKNHPDLFFCLLKGEETVFLII
ncbi:hypothetical protein BC833DRAFT_251990 [Globomyces pollinis-pini]|nr:hypothetical protein BC833DRAFT_251990 [Globomyces pollinis-pini]